MRQGGREGNTEDARVHAATALQPVFTGCCAWGNCLERPQGPLWASPLHRAIFAQHPQHMLSSPSAQTLGKAEPLPLWTRCRASWCKAWGGWEWSCSSRRKRVSGASWPCAWGQPFLEAKASGQGLRVRQAEWTWGTCDWIHLTQVT